MVSVQKSSKVIGLGLQTAVGIRIQNGNGESYRDDWKLKVEQRQDVSSHYVPEGDYLKEDNAVDANHEKPTQTATSLPESAPEFLLHKKNAMTKYVDGKAVGTAESIGTGFSKGKKNDVDDLYNCSGSTAGTEDDFQSAPEEKAGPNITQKAGIFDLMNAFQIPSIDHVKKEMHEIVKDFRENGILGRTANGEPRLENLKHNIGLFLPSKINSKFLEKV